MDAFIGEIRAFAFPFAPQNWLMCDGHLYSISQFNALFSIIGLAFGGNGSSTFAVPNLQGQLAMGAGNGPALTPRQIGKSVGVPNVTLTVDQTASHTHSVTAVVKTAPGAAGMIATPASNTFLSRLQNSPASAAAGYDKLPLTARANLNPLAISAVGGSSSGAMAHENQQPYLPLIFAICYEGVYPQRP